MKLDETNRSTVPEPFIWKVLVSVGRFARFSERKTDRMLYKRDPGALEPIQPGVSSD